ncbi:MAG TPA: T9SS type A sorting domain-containing protein [Cyclobacteriaceae bacterium]|nr:T9SS type A sorting domain-containing protein [Cyclobacteriaceae bacterium]
MKKVFTIFLIIALFFPGKAQKLSTAFQPIIKDTPPNMNVVQHTDGNYLVYGYFNYIKESPSGSLIKVDSKGIPVAGFQKIFTDGTISMVRVLPGGKIIILGDYRYLNGVRVPHIIRLNEDGSLDTGFHLDVTDRIDQFVVQSTGKVVASVNLAQPGPTQSSLVRFDISGHSDATFTFGLAPGPFKALAVDQHDNVLISYGNYIRRVVADGGIDNTFTDVDLTPSDNPSLIALEHDGKILGVTGTNPWKIRRFNPDGTPDNSFTSVDFVGGWIWSIVERQNGKIMTAGGFTSVDSNEAYAAELNADGTYSQKILMPNINLCYQVYEAAAQNVFVTGGFETVNGLTRASIVMLNSNYVIDSSFNPGLSRTPSYAYPDMVAVQSDGRVLVGELRGGLGAGNDPSRLTRLLPDGSADATFQASMIDTAPDWPLVHTVVVQDDDKIVVGGNRVSPLASTALARLLRPAFFGISVLAEVQSIVVKNARIYVSGFFDSFDGQSFNGFVILDQDGRLISPQQNSVPPNSYIIDIAAQSTGKIVLVGKFPVGPGDNRNFIRINVDGSLDNSFQLTALPGNFVDLDVDDQDNILVAGNSIDYQNNVLKRFTPDGVADNTLNFGAGFISAVPTNLVTAHFVSVLPGGKIAVGGDFAGYNNVSSPAFVLLDGQGSLIPVEDPFDSATVALSGAYNKKSNILAMTGYFEQDHAQIISSGAKLVFPIISSVSDFNAHATSESSMELSWTGSYSGADQIVVERSTPDQSNYAKIATLLPSVTSYQATALNEVTPYYFRITGGNGGYAGTSLEDHDTTAIAPEVSLAATDITTSSFTANWNYLAGTDSTMLQVSGDNFATFVPGREHLITKSGANSVTGLQDGKAYQYRVKRFRNEKVSDYSLPITVNVITGMEGSNGMLDVHVYPNPVGGTLIVDLPGNSVKGTATIHSVRGELVGNYALGEGSHSKIDTHTLSPGMFILTIYNGGSYRKFKVIKEQN